MRSGDCGQSVLDAANFGRQRLGERQAEHGERTVSLDVEQALRQRAATGLGQAAVDDENTGQSVPVLAEIGQDRSLPIFYFAVAQTRRVEAVDGVGGFRPLGPDLEPDARDQ